MSFRWESIEGWNFVLSSHFYSEKQIPREQAEKPRSAKELLGFCCLLFADFTNRFLSKNID